MLTKIVTLFLIGMGVLAMFGKNPSRRIYAIDTLRPSQGGYPWTARGKLAVQVSANTSILW